MPRPCWLAAFSLSLVGCGAGSVYPFYGQGQSYVDSSLVGAWRDPGRTEGVVITPEGTQYGIVFTDSHGKSARFVGTLFSLGGRRALDVTVGELPDSAKVHAPDEYWALLLPAHTLFYVDWTATRLAFTGIVPDSVKSYLRIQPYEIRHYYTGRDSTVVLDAPTADVQRFLIAFARRPHVLADSTIWARAPR